jgi:3-hydroxybutyryl-CoA dehydrogenase
LARFETAAVIGTGMMGPGIALTLALGGVRATILSRSPESAAEGLAKANAQLKLLGDAGLAPEDKVNSAMRFLSSTDDFLEAVASADLVIESAPENMEFKQDLFERLDAATKPDTVLTSNTSGLSITAIASRCSRPERVLTTHFWNPPHLMPLVEVVLGERSDPAIAEVLSALLAKCGKRPVLVKKDTPGQLGNRLQMALVREAAHIIEAGIADAEAVDEVVRSSFGLRFPVYGLLEHMDIVGLDMATSIAEYVATDLYSEPRAPQIMRDKLASGDLGVKSGRGFYDWSRKDAGAVKSRRDRFVLDFLKRWGGSV